MVSLEGPASQAATKEYFEENEDISIMDKAPQKRKLPNTSKSQEITTRTIKNPAYSYAWLEVICDPSIGFILDSLTVRSYLTAALAQFLGLTGSAISVDILKVEQKECWIRVPRQDLGAVVATLGGWVGHGENSAEVGWRIRASGNWLGSLVGVRSAENVWSG
jgi:ribonuclease P/MRP protein subunit POP8